MTDLDSAKRTNAEIPGAVQGGVIESVKTAVMVALQEALVGSTLDGASSSDISVNMEYPMEKEHYPGIWVQFSFTEFVNAGLGHELIRRNDDDDDWELIREFQFRGTVTLTIVALTNLERDRLSDSVTTMFMFSRLPWTVLTKPDEDTKQFKQLWTSLLNNPYVAISINQDMMTPGGQTMTPGVPWDDELPGYEDNYSFEILGQANIVFRRDGTYSLRAIDTIAELHDSPGQYDWQ